MISHVQKHVMMKDSNDSPDAGVKPSGEAEKKDAEDPGNESRNPTEGKDKVNAIDAKTSIELLNNPNMPELEDIVYSDDNEDVGAEADMKNLDAFMPVSPILTTRIHKDHPVEQIIGDLHSTPQTRRMTKNLEEHEEPKKVFHALKDPSWIEAMQDELLQFKLQKNKARLVAQGYTQEEGIDYDEVFAPVDRIEAIRLFLAYALFKKTFRVYQGCQSSFLYGNIEEEVYVCQPPGFEDPDFPDRQKEDGIFISQDKYVTKILKKFGFTDIKTASTHIGKQNPLLKDADGEEVDEHLYRSMIGSLMYLTFSRPDIMFTICACARFQVNHKSFNIFNSCEKIFKIHKRASLDRKSTTRGCQFLGCKLISWQCKKQTMVANSTTEAEYIVASNCCGQVLWIQNQLLDYGYNFMQTRIHIDNVSTICIVKNPFFHSKTKNIEIRHHFIRDSYEKKLIQMNKIHMDQNVADSLTKAFDVSRFQYLIASIEMLNL
ncbi:putative ribonuclease H-like domain-containing protein [Tanacetum coccineum]|uniref:Ribonuclease H-like domain-containing protein n=1 Tax=Tanacetum coccineum TaxID=301880 RepID=A0ABQ5BNG4_9ASTR